MSLTRLIETDTEFEFSVKDFDTLHNDEWKNELDPNQHHRLDEDGWDQRYEYEATLIDELIKVNPHIKNVLELGSGPGVLSQKVLEKHPNLNYHLVDKPYAKEYFDKHNFKGTFFVKDLANAFDTDGLLDKYDLVITNDFLEHVLNPSIIVQTIHKLTTPESYYFISNPNWRMCHQWIYRGLFDFDNFLYFLYTHNFRLAGFFGSPLKAAPYPKIDSEKMLPDSNLTDWNHYLIFTHRNEIIKNYVIPSS